MDLGTILNVAISLGFLFLLMSMIASTVQELVAGMWNSRGRHLQQAIGQMLGDPALQRLAGGFYRHPLIAGLLPPGTDCKRFAWLRRLLPFLVPRLPSYIAPATFADAITDILKQDGALRTGNMQPALAALWRAAAADEAKFRTAIADWYTAATQRQTGRFKRSVQRWLFAYGLLAAIFLNVDTLAIATALWSAGNQKQTAAIAAQAAAYLQAHAADKPGSVTLDAELAGLRGLSLPIGWSSTDPCLIARHVLGPTLFRPARLVCHDSGDSLAAAGPAVARGPDTVDAARWLGWVLTALAISLGAQFWFDLLGKIINLRGAGAIPAPSPLADAAGDKQTS